jgi:predicted choloylglycine hydrolase
VIHIEIKPSRRLATTELTAKFRAISHRYKHRPEHFIILTEIELRAARNQDFYQLINNNNVKGLS